jgi:hypothetical protein
MAKKVTAIAGKPYGHVPGHTYHDVEVEASGKLATLAVVWGSAQGYDEEHGRREYARRGSSLIDALDAVRDAALAEESDDAVRGYIETACARAQAEVMS